MIDLSDVDHFMEELKWWEILSSTLKDHSVLDFHNIHSLLSFYFKNPEKQIEVGEDNILYWKPLFVFIDSR